MNDLAFNVVIICLFLCGSAFFSAMEAAVFSISRFRLKTLLFEKRRGAGTLERLKRCSGKTLATILLANLLVNVGASSVGALILLQLIHRYELNTTAAFAIEFVVMTSIILIFGEIVPKTVALSNAEYLALRFGRVIEYLSWLFAPVSRPMEAVMQRAFGSRMARRPETISDNEIKLMLSEAKRFKVLDEGEEQFGYQILRFGKTTVSQIMTPRQRVVGVRISADLEHARAIVNAEKHSRMCVFDEKNEVVGILYAKDLFLDQIKNNGKGGTVRDIMREMYVVPETKHVDNLLAEFRKKGIHMSIVVDEFGSFVGIVTLEDILESLFGEIIDEYDDARDLPYEKVGSGEFLFEGEVNIADVARVLQIEPFAAEGERLSAFILDHAGRIPSEKDTIRLSAVELTVVEMHDRNIAKVLVRKL